MRFACVHRFDFEKNEPPNDKRRRPQPLKNKETEFTAYNPVSRKISNPPFIPRRWFLIAWPYQNLLERPDVCSRNGWENCVCLTLVVFDFRPSNFAQESKFCVESDQPTNINSDVSDVASAGPLEFSKIPITLSIDYQKDKITIYRKI